MAEETIDTGAGATGTEQQGQSGATAGFEGTTAGAAAPAQTTTTPGSESAGIGSAGATGTDASTGGGQQSGGQAAGSWTGARDYAERGLGIAGATQFADDEQFIQHVTAQAMQARQMQAELEQARQALYRQQQPSPAQTPPTPKPEPKFFDPPAYDPSWERIVSKDDAGNYKVQPGYDPAIVGKYLAYHDYRRDFADKLLTNPEATLTPFVETRAKSLAESIVTEKVEQLRQQVAADQFLRENSSWLHARDQGGQVLYDARTGKPQLSPLGQRFAGHLSASAQLGISGYEQQIAYAQGMTQRDAAMQHWNQSQQVATGQQQKQALLNPANRQPNAGGSLAGQLPGAGNGAPQNSNLSLREALAQAFRQEGITDADIAGGN